MNPWWNHGHAKLAPGSNLQCPLPRSLWNVRADTRVGIQWNMFWQGRVAEGIKHAMACGCLNAHWFCNNAQRCLPVLPAAACRCARSPSICWTLLAHHMDRKLCVHHRYKTPAPSPQAMQAPSKTIPAHHVVCPGGDGIAEHAKLCCLASVARVCCTGASMGYLHVEELAVLRQALAVLAQSCSHCCERQTACDGVCAHCEERSAYLKVHNKQQVRVAA
jgi:hypothetical protein